MVVVVVVVVGRGRSRFAGDGKALAEVPWFVLYFSVALTVGNESAFSFCVVDKPKKRKEGSNRHDDTNQSKTKQNKTQK
jgi:hypothetical protein